MKLFCVFIYFFFVDVLADDNAVYMDYVYKITQTYDIIAHHKYGLTDNRGRTVSGANDLEHVIETMVYDIDAKDCYKNSLRKLIFLIAVPDKIEIVLGIPEFQNDDPEKKANNLLLEMIEYIEKLLGFRYEETYNSDLGTLITIANRGRQCVAIALIRIIERRVLGVVQHVNDPSLPAKCRFIGIYLSAQTPELYMKAVEVNLTGLTCTFTDKNDGKKRYGYIDGKWSQISLDLGRPLESLQDQLRIGRL
ncbi:uncharacterized protein LOC126841233 [Adelges cooleyi]|uniref:uncharacterized protein LOC126841233 n=1 Tax=Adelges cooleyi TaxID=133065 RepID=UPI002180156D|nr:uncharacterized protein LOC126841233 [Adelges cooleyi]XP_050433527.1 uncharacterized protein LOC126841233 [Adelges cooleyi]